MVISLKVFIDVNNNFIEDDIKKVLKGNICRCIGYVKIIKVVDLVVKIFRENIDVLKVNCKGLVGENFFRVDVVGKVFGYFEYVDDMRIEGMIYGLVVRVKYFRVLVKKIDIEEVKVYLGVVVVLIVKDILGIIKVGYLKKDWDILILEGEIIRYLGDGIVLVVVEIREVLEEVKKLVKIDYEELILLSIIVDVFREDVLKIYEIGNIFVKEYLVRGNVKEKIENLKYVVIKRYIIFVIEYVFLEFECVVVGFYEEDGVIIYLID